MNQEVIVQIGDDCADVFVTQEEIIIITDGFIPGPPPTSAQIIAAFNTLGQYQSDSDALADGLLVGDWYITASGHNTHPEETLKRISA